MLGQSAAVLGLVAVVLCPRAAGAQEIRLRGPLTASVLIRRSLYRAGRVHVAALPAVVIGGEHDGALALAGRADFHPTDDVGIGMWGARGSGIGGAPGLGWAGAGQLTLVPAHGKLALLGSAILRMDLYAFGGIGAVTLRGQPTLGATFGGGTVLYLGEAVALTAEARAVSSIAMVSVGVVLALPPEARHECVVR